MHAEITDEEIDEHAPQYQRLWPNLFEEFLTWCKGKNIRPLPTDDLIDEFLEDRKPKPPPPPKSCHICGAEEQHWAREED